MVACVAAGAPAHAARECEQPFHVPTEGACARLATAELFYYDTGPVNAGRDETIILLHAASGNADAFRKNFAGLHAAGYRVIAYDRKNVGRSSNTLRDDALGRPRGSTVQDLDDLADHLGVGRFHLVGIAAGAQVALQYVAAHNPGRVLSLTLGATLGPIGLATNEPTLAALQRNIALPFEVFCPMAVANPPPPPLQLASPTGATSVNIPAVRLEHRELGTAFRATGREGVDEFERIGNDARHRTTDGCRTTSVGPNQPGLPTAHPQNPNTFTRLNAFVRARTLLLAGTGDVFYSPPAHMRLWGSHIADAQYAQLDTGHAPQFEDPERFNAALLRFLAGGHPFERLGHKP